MTEGRRFEFNPSVANERAKQYWYRSRTQAVLDQYHVCLIAMCVRLDSGKLYPTSPANVSVYVLTLSTHFTIMCANPRKSSQQ